MANNEKIFIPSNGLSPAMGLPESVVKNEPLIVNIQQHSRPVTVSLYLRITSAIAYGIASFVIVVVNKVILTHYKFPSPQTLGLGQMVATLIILQGGKSLNIITFCGFSRSLPSKIWPLPALYLGNLISGLDGTKHLNLPMFTVLRRFTILLTMFAEYFILRVVASNAIIISVIAMIGGAVVAAINDLAFDARGYTSVILNDCFTAGNNVYYKKMLQTKDIGRYGLIFYNVLLMIIPLFAIAYLTGELQLGLNFDQWLDVGFLCSFLSSCVMGFVLMYTTVLCTQYNSALTTTIIGCLKNMLVTYAGMVIGGDYVYSLTNFMGINISMIGSIFYTYLTFAQKESKPSTSADAKEINH